MPWAYRENEVEETEKDDMCSTPSLADSSADKLEEVKRIRGESLRLKI